jgi:hypothetical protein
VQRGWHDLGEFTRSRLLLATLLGCVLASGLLVAGLVAGADETATVGAPVAERPATLLPTSTAARTTAPPSPVGRRPTASKATAAIVERRLIERILAAPTRHLPRAFVEPRTGLVKNNVQIVCRRATTLSFRCTVRLARSATKSVVVRYRMRRDGTGEFTWQTSRTG